MITEALALRISKGLVASSSFRLLTLPESRSGRHPAGLQCTVDFYEYGHANSAFMEDYPQHGVHFRPGSWVWISFYDSDPSVDQVKELIEAIAHTLEDSQLSPLQGASLQIRPKGGHHSEARAIAAETSDLSSESNVFWARENGSLFHCEKDGSKHPGLFLDLKDLRQRLRVSSGVRGACALNSFAYTGALSVALRAGGARHVDTLDLSKPSLERARWNLEANSIEEVGLLAGTHAELARDLFQHRRPSALAGQLFYDLIICDPPSFSRSRTGSFSVDKDLEKLVNHAIHLGGDRLELIVSVNRLEMPREQFMSRVLNEAKRLTKRVAIAWEFGASEDFLLGYEPNDPARDYLKGVWLSIQR